MDRKRALLFKVTFCSVALALIIIVWQKQNFAGNLHQGYLREQSNDQSLASPTRMSTTSDPGKGFMIISPDVITQSVVQPALHNHNAITRKKDKVLILLWTPILGHYKRWGTYTREIVEKSGSCATWCEVTQNKSRVREADMVLFTGYEKDQIPLPDYRDTLQIWGFWSTEPPVPTYNGWEMTINWTLSYRLDSDIFVPYGSIQKKNEEERKEAEKNFEKEMKQILAAKTGLVAAIISHCRTLSKRENYIQELRKEGLEVHVYGRCGNYTCPQDRSVSSCYADLSTKYKFFLAFENSICRDYVTEKMFQALKCSWIPVVRGGANYSSFAPQRSVIDASNMSPAELVNTIKRIAADDKEYASYFEWKKTQTSYYGRTWACSVCEKLLALKSPQGQQKQISRTYPDIFDWWVTQAKCINP